MFLFFKRRKKEATKWSPGKWHSVKIEADMVETDGCQHYNLLVDDKLVGDYVRANENVSQVNSLELKASAETGTDDIYGLGYQQTTDTNHPYYPATFIDENFDEIPSAEGWQKNTYDDSGWQSAKLPFAWGSERHKGEDLYFRKKIRIEQFKRAYLNIETLDPGGEVWVNGKIVSVINNRYPVRLDITSFLNQFAENYIALKVNHFYLNPGKGVLSPHSYLDQNPGWFAGRASLEPGWGNICKRRVFLYKIAGRQQGKPSCQN